MVLTNSNQQNLDPWGPRPKTLLILPNKKTETIKIKNKKNRVSGDHAAASLPSCATWPREILFSSSHQRDIQKKKEIKK
jgi:hypothetical protein